jgi:hypothetical protein
MMIFVRLLLTVTEVFTIKGRGIVLLPELRPEAEERFRPGDALKLRKPDGKECFTRIGGLEFLKPLTGRCQLVVLLYEFAKEGIPIGTEVWSVEQN